MPVISKVGRSSPGARFTFVLMYTFLALGSVTMIWPFLMMLASSISSEADISDYRVVPRFLRDDSALLARFLNDKYKNLISTVQETYRFDLLRIDVRTGTVKDMLDKLRYREKLADPAQRKFLAEYDEFLAKDIPVDLYEATHYWSYGLIGPMVKSYQDWIEAKYGTIARVNKAYTEQYTYWAEITPPSERIGFRDWAPFYHERYREFIEFKKTLPAWLRGPFDGGYKWVSHLKYASDGDIAKLNAKLGTTHEDYWAVPLPLTAPGEPRLRALWEDFVRRKWPLRLIELNEQGVREYRAHLEARRKSIDRLNELYDSNYKSFEEIILPRGEQWQGVRQSDFIDFLVGEKTDLPGLNIANLSLRTTSGEFREWLLARHGGTIEGINSALGTKFSRADEILIPQGLSEWKEITTNRGQWRWHFVKWNYFEIVSFLLTKGRAFSNTVIYILLMIVIHLTINPLCAYALSRFNLSYAYKVLLFLLATMAFPAEVTMIPNFLLLRDLGLLNSFYALVLPGMANGFSIFLLKGFFDTLPKELYEAAQLDGAGELRMFYQITVPLCKPVFAYIALITFTGAYGAFLFALTVCQDPKMWTIMVWLYDLNATSPEHIKVAALTVAMIPTLIVFVSCQRVIMRGIVLPQLQ